MIISIEPDRPVKKLQDFEPGEIFFDDAYRMVIEHREDIFGKKDEYYPVLVVSLKGGHPSQYDGYAKYQCYGRLQLGK